MYLNHDLFISSGSVELDKYFDGDVFFSTAERTDKI